MILLAVDEAYAFDFLAILHIKKDLNATTGLAYNKTFASIKQQVGSNLFDTIINSAEYKNLLAANQRTFDSVNLARENKISAYDLDKSNYDRFLAKKELQTKFFNTELTETKKYNSE